MTPQEINSNQPLTKKNTSTHIFQDQIKDKFEKKSYMEVWLRFVYFIIQWWHRRNNLKGNLQNNRIICVNGIKNRLKCGTMSTLCLLLETNRKIYNYCPQLEILALLQERRWLVLSIIIVISFFLRYLTIKVWLSIYCMLKDKSRQVVLVYLHENSPKNWGKSIYF